MHMQQLFASGSEVEVALEAKAALDAKGHTTRVVSVPCMDLCEDQDDDYKKAGYQLLPSNTGRTKESAMQVIIYSAVLIPLSFLPHIFGISGELSMFCVTAGSILLTLFSFK